MPSASTAFLDAMNEAGITHVFANWGSDHPGLIEAWAEARAHGRPSPRIVTCPNEMVALSAAHGFAQVSGRAQAVIVHVECGTQALAGAVHNADKGRVPVLIFAGTSPVTQEGEAKGSRNEFIQWIQDVHDQRGIVRGYMRYDAEIRSARNIKQMMHRALSFAGSDPKGPVYLTAAREILEEEVELVAIEPARCRSIAPIGLAHDVVETLVEGLLRARRPLVVTSYLGRQQQAVGELVRLCERLGMAVLESVPKDINFPADHPLYQGNQWNHPGQNAALAAADHVLVVDSDVPWIPTVSRPAPDAVIHHIDIDPLKQQMPLWHVGASLSVRADSLTALRQLNSRLDRAPIDPALVKDRTEAWAEAHRARAARLRARETPGRDDAIGAEYVLAALRRQLDPDTLVINEAVSHLGAVCDHLARTMPGSMIGSGGGSLGYSGGAAIGAKLACPEKTVVVICGDGTYLFSAPSSVHWIARAYETPFLTLVLNNRGWKSPKLSALAIHPKGHASRANEIDVAFDPPPDYGGIAFAAGGAYARIVRQPEEVEGAIASALHAVRVEGRAAILDVWLERL